MPSKNQGLIVPTYPTPIDDLTSCRRSSLTDIVNLTSSSTSVAARNSTKLDTKLMVLPLMTSTDKSKSSSNVNGNMNNGRIGSKHGLYKIDPVAISLAAKAKRQQQQQSSPPQQQQQSSIYINRRGSLDAHVEYAVAMVNIIDPKHDMDDRDMCPFGTRRDSVCGGGGGGNNNYHNHNNDNHQQSPVRVRRRILKKQVSEVPNCDTDSIMDTTTSENTEICKTVVIPFRNMDDHDEDTTITNIKSGNNDNNNNDKTKSVQNDNVITETTNPEIGTNQHRPLTLTERIYFY